MGRGHVTQVRMSHRWPTLANVGLEGLEQEEAVMIWNVCMGTRVEWKHSPHCVSLRSISWIMAGG